MGSLTQEQVRQFGDQGYLVVKGLFDPEEDLDPIIAEYEGVLDQVVDRLLASGDISSRYEDLPFGKRLIRIHQESGKSLIQHFDFSLPQNNIKADTPIWLGPAVFHALANRKMLDAIESLIGPEIYVNPIQHVRLKLPEAAVPEAIRSSPAYHPTDWHQDNGVGTTEIDKTTMITVWYPLWDAPISSGPLKIVPNSHRLGLFTHCPLQPGGIAIPDKLLDEQPMLSLPMKRGDVLFMSKLTAHSSLPNTSDNIRWSFDLRYNPVGQPSGRDAFPGFIGRSRRAPETELHDPVLWADRWLETRARLAAAPPSRPFNRWDGNATMCA